MDSTLIILLDSEHLDQSLFMKSFAQKLVAFKKRRLILVHGDNSFSKQLIKNGMNENDAIERSIKEINLKLISLFADSVLPAIGIHGYQRNVVKLENESIQIDGTYLNSLPEQAMLILTNLVGNSQTEMHKTISTAQLAFELSSRFANSTCLCFAVSDIANLSFKEIKPSEIELLNLVPEEVLRAGKSFYLTTLSDFQGNIDSKVAI